MSEKQPTTTEQGNDDELDDETFERASREKRSQPASDDEPSDQDIGKD
jgi:hypothetical protein